QGGGVRLVQLRGLPRRREQVLGGHVVALILVDDAEVPRRGARLTGHRGGPGRWHDKPASPFGSVRGPEKGGAVAERGLAENGPGKAIDAVTLEQRTRGGAHLRQVGAIETEVNRDNRASRQPGHHWCGGWFRALRDDKRLVYRQRSGGRVQNGRLHKSPEVLRIGFGAGGRFRRLAIRAGELIRGGQPSGT